MQSVWAKALHIGCHVNLHQKHRKTNIRKRFDRKKTDSFSSGRRKRTVWVTTSESHLLILRDGETGSILGCWWDTSRHTGTRSNDLQCLRQSSCCFGRWMEFFAAWYSLSVWNYSRNNPKSTHPVCKGWYIPVWRVFQVLTNSGILLPCSTESQSSVLLFSVIPHLPAIVTSHVSHKKITEMEQLRC